MAMALGRQNQERGDLLAGSIDPGHRSGCGQRTLRSTASASGEIKQPSAIDVQSILAVVDYLQRPDIRDSRRVVLTELESIPAPHWTAEQRAIASGVAASYDLVGTLLRTNAVDGALILQSYGASIIRCHETCLPMIDDFRENMPAALARSYWDDFDWLAEEARKMLGHVGPARPRGPEVAPVA
nr:hypothetical protein [Propionibacterium sp.]